MNLEGRPQRQRRAVDPAFPDELEFFARVGERLAIPIAAWPSEALPGRARAPARARPAQREASSRRRPSPPASGVRAPAPHLPLARSAGPASSGSRALAFQRPALEVELSAHDAGSRGIAAGDSSPSARTERRHELRARINRRLRPGVVRIADENAKGLETPVEVTKA